MKNLSALCLVVMGLFFFSSCGSTTHKGCSGKGSWSGNRNLGAIDHDVNKQDAKTYYAVVSKEEMEQN